MNRVVIFYNPYIPELKISIDNRKLSPYSVLMSYENERIEKWCDVLFSEIYREVNTEYEVLCISTGFACRWMEALAEKERHCISFESAALPLVDSVYDRLYNLEMIGCEEDPGITIPVYDASSAGGMNEAVYEILESQGLFSSVSQEEILWSECPLTSIVLKTYRYGEQIDSDVPFLFALCSREEDAEKVFFDIPVYAMVMGTETKFLRKSGNKLLFSIDSDELADVLLNVIEEEALCPLLSYLWYNFPEDEKAFLLEEERERLSAVCLASPKCYVKIPKIMDLGRREEIRAKFVPSKYQMDLHIVSDYPDVISTENNVLIACGTGTAEINVFVGDDPYPVSTEIIEVRDRNLINNITLFPSVLCLPCGGIGQIQMTFLPENAENADEIRWYSENENIVEVNPYTGEIYGKHCGDCQIRVETAEIQKTALVKVQSAIEDILCPFFFVEMCVGEQKEWKYSVVPENAYGVDLLRVISTNKNVADYRGGYIVGNGIGECKIYVKTLNGELSRELRVIVKKGKWGW